MKRISSGSLESLWNPIKSGVMIIEDTEIFLRELFNPLAQTPEDGRGALKWSKLSR